MITSLATTNAAAPLRVAVWRRLSTEDQNREGRAGLQRQRDQTDRLVAARGYEVVATFEVVDVSGTTVTASPEWLRLRQMIERGEVAGVVASEFSRLVRPNNMEALSILDILLVTAACLSRTVRNCISISLRAG